MPSVTIQAKETEASDAKYVSKGYSSLSPDDEKNEGSDWRHMDERNDLELDAIGCQSSHESLDEGLILEDLEVSFVSGSGT